MVSGIGRCRCRSTPAAAAADRYRSLLQRVDSSESSVLHQPGLGPGAAISRVPSYTTTPRKDSAQWTRSAQSCTGPKCGCAAGGSPAATGKNGRNRRQYLITRHRHRVFARTGNLSCAVAVTVRTARCLPVRDGYSSSRNWYALSPVRLPAGEGIVIEPESRVHSLRWSSLPRVSLV